MWSDALGDFLNSPAVVDGVVYVGSSFDSPFNDDALYALSGKTGAKLWTFAPGNWVLSSAAEAKGVVYAGSYDGNLYALDTKTGKKLWSYLAGGYVIPSPAEANGVVYIANDAATLYALNAETGAKLWESSFGAGSFASPVVADGMVYLPGYDYGDNGNLYAFGLK